MTTFYPHHLLGEEKSEAESKFSFLSKEDHEGGCGKGEGGGGGGVEGWQLSQCPLFIFLASPPSRLWPRKLGPKQSEAGRPRALFLFLPLSHTRCDCE